MKNIRNMFISIIPIMTLMNTQPSLSFQEKSAALLKKMQGPGFEVFNKANDTITITIFVEGKFLRYADIPGRGGKFELDINVKQPMQLGIYTKETPIKTGVFSREIEPQPDYFYNLNAPGRTKYLTWRTGNLYPQTGTYMGLSGKSDSGYQLGSNLQRNQIIKT